jgi:putative membrane protein
MVNASTVCSEEEAAAICASIAEIESASQAEIVCAVASESGRYDRAEGIVGIGTAMLALLIGNSLLPEGVTEDGGWIEYASLSAGAQVLLVGLGYLLGNVLASYLPMLRRLCTPSSEMTREVDRAVAQVFASQHLRRTRDAAGLLVYVSLYERQIRLLADDGIPLDLTDTLELALPALKAGSVAAAFHTILDAVAEPLVEALPALDKENELKDHLLRFHPRP